MSKLRLVFVKEHQASYISHLDVMRTFQRVFPRAGLSIKHSNGFHPHPILSIVLPLPVGQSSECEILDFESVEESTGEGVAEALNTGMPAGLRVLDCYGVTRPVREMVNLRAQLEMEYDNGVPEGACERIRTLFTQEEIFVEKRTKHKGMTELNIAPLLRSLTLTDPRRCRRRRAGSRAQPRAHRRGRRAAPAGDRAGLCPRAQKRSLRQGYERFPLRKAHFFSFCKKCLQFVLPYDMLP